MTNLYACIVTSKWRLKPVAYLLLYLFWNIMLSKKFMMPQVPRYIRIPRGLLIWDFSRDWWSRLKCVETIWRSECLNTTKYLRYIFFKQMNFIIFFFHCHTIKIIFFVILDQSFPECILFHSNITKCLFKYQYFIFCLN